MSRIPIRTPLAAAAALLVAGGMVAACSSGGSSSSGKVVIKAVLPPNTGAITASDNAGLKKLTDEYQSAHKNVTVQWLPNNTASITAANATVETQASGGSAPDLVWEQYGPVTSGALPKGLLQNIKPFLDKPNPYVPGNSSWLSLFSPSTVPYMTSPNGDIDIILGSNVETGMFYSKAAFAKAGISSTPTSWADFITDLGKLKSAGVTPFIFADGGLCNPSWFERLATSSLLSSQVSQFDVNHAQVTNGLDVAVGIKKGIISMSNPRYAEVWKLLGQLVKYSAKGQSGYDACSAPNATSPPLSTQSLLAQGKVGILWGGSWYIPQLSSAGFSTSKFGVFPEPPITSTSTSLAAGTSTVGVIGGPNGNGQWGVTSQQADHTMTPQKTGVVMNFLAWLFTPPHLGYWIKINQSGADIPTEPAAPTVNLPGLKNLVPSAKVPTVVDVVLDDVLSTAATNSGLRLVQDYVDGSMSYSAFASQWQSLLNSSAQSWATQNSVDLSKY
ncbi:MAG TPA: ABC transporter substrate-binding protein [Streptosporangiaceae bacterium]|nr:ABC transporter substrate-binding protein [Streptosporangiaceae bacterium]